MTRPTTPDDRFAADSVLGIKHEAVCFAFLSERAVLEPFAIEEVMFDLASVDYFGCPRMWVTLDVKCPYAPRTSVIGFDGPFFRRFVLTFIKAGSDCKEHILSIPEEKDGRQHVAEYVTHRNGEGYKNAPVPPRHIILTPYANTGTLISACWSTKVDGQREDLFQLPRTNAFLRAFARVTNEALHAIEGMKQRMEGIEFRRAMEQGR